jgi:hypothetical protein
MVDARVVITALIGSQIGLMFVTRSLSKDLLRYKQEYKKLYETSQYLLHILMESNVDISEFDLIALELLSEDNNAKG